MFLFPKKTQQKVTETQHMRKPMMSLVSLVLLSPAPRYLPLSISGQATASYFFDALDSMPRTVIVIVTDYNIREKENNIIFSSIFAIGLSRQYVDSNSMYCEMHTSGKSSLRP